MDWGWWALLGGGFFLFVLLLRDLTQPRHAILRNFPIVGRARYLFEKIGPGLRQYIVARNDEERPFSRDQRSWVYASAKKQNNYFGFGTDNDLERAPNHLIIKQSPFPLLEARPGDESYDPNYLIPCAKVLGGARGRAKAFRPQSIVHVSAMSYGSLSAPAVEAINKGCALASAMHNTGEGGVAPHHDHGGDLIWQLGTGYYGCRDSAGNFDLPLFLECVEKHQIRAIEIKLSQGAKPGMGGVLPSAKITPEIARIRCVPQGRDCISPARHATFSDVDSMLDWVELLAEKTGLPVGIKSAVGEQQFWNELACQMTTSGRGVDFISVDGGEGGTGAAPLTFSDHVSLPFKQAFVRVYREFFEQGIASDVVFIGGGKLGFPAEAALSFALGCDMIQVAREAMLAIGCIQAQECHTGFCPTGVATQSSWLMRGLDPTDKSARLANYLMTLRKELLQLSHVCSHVHPALIKPEDCEILDERFGSETARDVFALGNDLNWGMPSSEHAALLPGIMNRNDCV